jgi:hypothetical protein
MARRRLEAGRGAREGARAADVQRTAQAAEFALGTLEDFTRAEARIQAPPRPAPTSPKAGVAAPARRSAHNPGPNPIQNLSAGNSRPPPRHHAPA